jgi:hypothetical protein
LAAGREWQWSIRLAEPDTLIGVEDVVSPRGNGKVAKVFWFFFSKKNRFLSLSVVRTVQPAPSSRGRPNQAGK